jgi:predicted TIM-barrel fold metal-dependent hydrolase
MFIDRIDSTGLRTFDKDWNTKIYVTTSAFHTVCTFQQLRQVTPIERITYSVDYPFSSTTDGWKFINALAESRVLTDDEMDMFACKNAKRLLVTVSSES